MADFLEEYQTDEPLEYRAEYGWNEVSSALGRVLFGHLLHITASVVAIATIVAILSPFGDNPVALKKLSPGQLWLLYGACGLSGLAGLIGYYWYVLVGQWRCLMNAPERAGARWLMFTSMTCLMLGPIFIFIASMMGDVDSEKVPRMPWAKKKEAGRNAFNNPNAQMQPFDESMKEIKSPLKGVKLYVLDLDTLPGCIRFASVVFGVMSMVSFVFFLRSIAKCFGDNTRVFVTHLYLTFTALLFGVFIGLVNSKLTPEDESRLGLAILAGIVLDVVIYLFLIASMRTCIYRGLKKIRSPLQADVPEHV